LERLVRLVDELVSLFSGAVANGEVIGVSSERRECRPRC
jgi:hypothetical protein